ncbi:MAG TPA: thioredoxin domain-containing protein [Candidatus Dormibacteraeota bacterium]|nr:thioredoxin domain-containing protein [Candidatus Dormibacteraeota bacterium]
MSAPTNRLGGESSPYLRQHAHNPVDWYPWGAEAFERARRERRPVLLSIGYSACHWCHVMERESFENPAIAALMNEHFVNIKVDREERPDVDHIYMNAVQLLTGHGGWPMTAFLTPEGQPFYGGTYFPPEDRHGLPGFPRLLRAIAQAWHERPDDVAQSVRDVHARLEQLEVHRAADALPGAEAVRDAVAQLARAYDADHGGIGTAPKFPNTAVFDLFLRAGARSGDARITEMTLHTLRRMAEGGIYDQLGGGFHRYSVDQRWLAPHFEKMLYDNAQLVTLYLAAHQHTGDPFFARIARQTLDYVLREMRDPAGGFWSTQDADSEGEEGRFFLWDEREVLDLLGGDAAALACRYWDVSEHGNFEHRNILHVTIAVEQLARLVGRDVAGAQQALDAARATLFAARERRIKPGLDSKILTSWNGLMISAFARAGELFDEPRYRQAAVDAVAFVNRELLRDDRLRSTWKDGVARLNGYLDDYVFFAAALLDLFEAVQERTYLTQAARMMDSALRHFWDDAAGGFFFTSDDHETLIVRSKPAFDGSIPSGNSVAVLTLLRLAHYLDRHDYRERAEACLRLFAEPMRAQPFGFANLLAAVDFYADGPLEVAVVGDPQAAATTALLARLRGRYLPNRTLMVLDPADPTPRPALLEGKTAVAGKPTVYVCRHRSCSPPATEWDDIARLLA